MIQATLPRRAAPQLDLNQLAQQVMQPWTDAFENWRSGVADLVKPTTKPTSKGQCGCPACNPDPCGCRCCVSDADLVIEARLGERRIVPIIIENHWRRERDIELELSSWTKIGDNVAITAHILGETTIKLAPCGEAHVVIGVNVGLDTVAPPPPNPPTTNVPPPDTRLPLPDVDRCLVSYADLRIKGCDLRSIRIAVAVLPRDCDSYTVDCDCCCC
jgi:hypothetical protein